MKIITAIDVKVRGNGDPVPDFRVSPEAAALLEANGWKAPTPVRLCSIEGCGGKIEARGFCDKHYTRLKRHGDPLSAGRPKAPKKVRKCSVQECDRPHRTRGYCTLHYQRVKRNGDPLTVIRETKAPTTKKAAPRGPKPKKELSALELRALDFEVKKDFPEFKPLPMPEAPQVRPVHAAPAAPVQPCLVAGCGEPRKPQKSYGYCAAHLTEWETTGHAPDATAPARLGTTDPVVVLERQRERLEAERRQRLAKAGAR